MGEGERDGDRVGGVWEEEGDEEGDGEAEVGG